MRRAARGAPGDFARRLDRARAIDSSEANRAPLSLLIAVLEHQQARSAVPEVRAAAARAAESAPTSRLLDRFPLLDLRAAAEPLGAELDHMVGALGRSPATPEGLREAAWALSSEDTSSRREVVRTWLDDPSLLDPRWRFWVGMAAAPILEGAAAGIEPPSKAEWSSSACPACGGPPQVSVIEEESGEFMAGSPRYLICSRCALWWGYARATCPSCGEDESTKLSGFVSDAFPSARIDMCDTCHAYIKTFDLRQPGASDVVPLVDDVATLALDVWAHDQGLARPSLSAAGV